ncbi:MAG: sulfatase-like hydrolase/transferase [Pirellula sp.]
MVILCDDIGYGDLSCFGHPYRRMPNLDRLTSRCMLFTDSYSTSPICSTKRRG